MDIKTILAMEVASLLLSLAFHVVPRELLTLDLGWKMARILGIGVKQLELGSRSLCVGRGICIIALVGRHWDGKREDSGTEICQGSLDVVKSDSGTEICQGSIDIELFAATELHAQTLYQISTNAGDNYRYVGRFCVLDFKSKGSSLSNGVHSRLSVFGLMFQCPSRAHYRPGPVGMEADLAGDPGAGPGPGIGMGMGTGTGMDISPNNTQNLTISSHNQSPQITVYTQMN
eukprot:360010-Amorphochlora_amoeboformis.AAC.1